MYYRTLGVKRRASLDDIRKAFHTLAVQVHPDKPGGSVELFQALQKAYEVLSDEKARASYDEELEKDRLKLRGYKRPPEFDVVRSPVHFKLADDEYYAFETAPDKLKCTFRHGDIVSWKNQTGCFIGLAADNYLYWCVDGKTYASQLCQRESFAVGTVSVLFRAHFKSQKRSLPSSIQKKPPACINTRAKPSDTRRASEEKSHEMETTTPGLPSAAGISVTDAGAAPTAPYSTNTTMKGGRNVLSEAERLRRDIMRREREERVREKIILLMECEKKNRVRLMEKIAAALEDRQQEFRDWIAAGDGDVTADREEPPWITYAKQKEAAAGGTGEYTGK